LYSEVYEIIDQNTVVFWRLLITERNLMKRNMGYTSDVSLQRQ